MPGWSQVVIGSAALIAAVGVIWRKLIRPLARFITATEEALPVLQQLVEESRQPKNDEL